MKIIDNYLQANQDLISEFYKTYYNEWEYPSPSDWQYDIDMIWVDRHWVGMIWLNDDFWSIEQIFTAIKFNIPEKILFDYHELEYEKASKWEPVWINLYSYFRQSKLSVKEIEKEDDEDLKKSKARYIKARQELLDVINK